MIAAKSTCFLLTAAPLTIVGQQDKPPAPIEWHAGPVNIRPSGFVYWIGEWRSTPTSDSIWTHFARVPLVDGPDGYLGAAGHSRGMVKGSVHEGCGRTGNW